jgi:hypothetical protein
MEKLHLEAEKIMPDETYKLRITNQIRVLIQNKDSTNIRLGVVVTEDINTTASNKLRTSSAYHTST